MKWVVVPLVLLLPFFALSIIIMRKAPIAQMVVGRLGGEHDEIEHAIRTGHAGKL